jgi:hypothetical protein
MRITFVHNAERCFYAELDGFLGHCLFLQDHDVGRLVTTQMLAGLGTLSEIRSSARHEYWFVRQRSTPASVVPPYGLYISSNPMRIQ